MSAVRSGALVPTGGTAEEPVAIKLFKTTQVYSQHAHAGVGNTTVANVLEVVVNYQCLTNPLLIMPRICSTSHTPTEWNPVCTQR